MTHDNELHDIYTDIQLPDGYWMRVWVGKGKYEGENTPPPVEKTPNRERIKSRIRRKRTGGRRRDG